MTNKLLIPCELVSLNEYISANRTNKFRAAKIKIQQTNLCAFFAKEQNLTLDLNKQYDLKIEWFTALKNKDSDNVFFSVKFILDGIVKAGILKSDGFKNIRNISNIRTIGKSGIIVNFEEV